MENSYSDIIEVKDVIKEFSRLDGSIIRAVGNQDGGTSFSVREGEVFGLLGPNGAGKTTTLRMISTVFEPTSGTIKVAGMDTKSSPKKIRRLQGFLSGSTGLYRRLTAEEMIRYFGDLYGIEKEILDTRVEELMNLLDLQQYRNVQCEKLSSGNKQKVSIARTVIHDPKILVFDEPTVGLDVIIAESLLEFIESLKKENKTLVISTHIMEEAERLCDRIGLINNGIILFVGTTQEILEKAETSTLKEAFFKMVKMQNEEVSQ